MANYRIREIIRLARKAEGMSQEDLEEVSGVSVDTISRIERGLHKVNYVNYKKIMSALNRDSAQYFAICSSDTPNIMETKKNLDDAITSHEYDKAQKYIEKLKGYQQSLDVSFQYILRSETVVNYRNKKIDVQTHIENLEYALSRTIVNYRKFLMQQLETDKVYPFTIEELYILNSLANAYLDTDMFQEAELIFRGVIRNLQSGYIIGKESRKLALIVQRNRTFALDQMDREEESVEILYQLVDDSIKEKNGKMLVLALYDLVWTMKEINLAHERKKFDYDEIKYRLRQVYYISAARNDNHIRKLSKRLYSTLFDEELL